MLRVPGQAPALLSGPPQLLDASNWTGELADGCAGLKSKAGTGNCVGGRITPGGTRRICTLCGLALAKLVPVAVATIVTQVPGSCPQVPNTPFDGLGGAV